MSQFLGVSKTIKSKFQGFLHVTEFVGLVGIGVATAAAMGIECWAMISHQAVSLTDLLLMFLYLEILAMVEQYFRAGQLPVRFPLYIAIVALARELILGMGKSSESHLLATAGAILIIVIGVWILKFSSEKGSEPVLD